MSWLSKLRKGLVVFAMATGMQAQAADNAVILLYHHVAKNTPPSTSISPEQFARHMDYLKANYQVLPLEQVIEALQAKQPLPDNTVVITFDDGYNDILANAHPVLKAHQFPYTVFINPKVIGHQGGQLSWDEVKQMQSEGVTFANHTQDHLHMLARDGQENQQAWLTRVWQNVTDAEDELLAQTGTSLKYLAYPFGEFNSSLQQRVRENGYVGFGQQSGAISSYSDFTALPRFPAAGVYANLETLKTKLASLAMPVSDSSLDDPVVQQGTLHAPITLTIAGDDADVTRLSCFYQNSPLPLTTNGREVQFSIRETLPVGRSRVNCTAPSLTQSGRYYWYSQPFFVADEQGQYPN